MCEEGKPQLLRGGTRHAGRKLPLVAEEFTSFLQSYIATWAGRSGVL